MKSTEVDLIIPTIPPSLHNSFSTTGVCATCLASLIERLVDQVYALYLQEHLITLNMEEVTIEGYRRKKSLHLSRLSHSFWLSMWA